MTKQQLSTIHSESIAEFNVIEAAHRMVRMQCLEDRRFYSIAGAQWEGRVGEQFENKPKFEVNKIHLSVMRIINEYRNNRITVNFVSKDGEKHDPLADILDGLYRSDEQDSIANEAYDNAFEEAVGGGFGAWRLTTQYEDEYDDEDDRMRIRIEPIYDADSSVFWDLNAKRQDKRDAKVCYVLTSITTEEYKEKYDDDPSSWAKSVEKDEFDWGGLQDDLYIAEKYKVEETTETIYVYEDISGNEERFTEDELDEEKLAAIGSTKVREKKVKRRRVHKYIMSGGKVLEDVGYIAGTEIPIVPVFGKRWYVDNIERCMGHVRLSKDMQRLKNMQISKLAELMALSSREKPIVTPEQMLGHTVMWSRDNIDDYAYALLNPMKDKEGNSMPAGPLAYTKPPIVPPAMAALLQLTEIDMKEILGNQEEGEKILSNVSGEALSKVQVQLGMQTYIYLSNMEKAVQRSGEIWMGMARDTMVEAGRKMKIVGVQGEVSSIELSQPSMNTETGKMEYTNDISNAKYNVSVQVGPSSSSKREATVRSLIAVLQISQDPETRSVLESMIMMNMEGEGVGDANSFYRKKLVRIGAVKPTKEEEAELELEAKNAPPDPNTEYLLAEAKKALAEADNEKVDTLKKLAEVESIQAETMETLAGIDLKDEQSALNTLKTIREMNPTAATQPIG